MAGASEITSPSTRNHGAFRFTFAHGPSVTGDWIRLLPEFFVAVSDAVLPRHGIDTPPPPFLFACTPEKMPNLWFMKIPIPVFPLDLLA